MKNYFEQFPGSYVEGSKRIIHTPSPIAKEGFFYIQETGYLKLKESPIARLKQFDSYLIAYVISGSGTLEYQDATYELHPHSCLYINCNNPYVLQSHKDNPWALLWIHFNGISMPTYYHYYKTQFSPVLNIHNHEEVVKKLHTIYTINQDADFYTEISNSKLILDLITLLLLSKPQNKETANSDLLEKLKEVRTYLDHSYTDKLSLEMLSSQFYISKYHLCHEFKKHYGITINQYIMDKRINAVKRLLRFSKMSINEIAKECGFYDSSYLNKCFKSLEGISLKEYRKRWG